MNLAIIGSGKIVNDLVSFINEIPAINLVAIYGREQSFDKLAKLQKENGINEVYTDYKRLLQNPSIDTVYVALPNDLHFAYAKKGLLAKKNVIVEKPFVQTLEQFYELKNIAVKHHLHLYEAISNQYSPNFIALKKWISVISPVHLAVLNYSQYSSRYDLFKSGMVLPTFDADRGGGALQDLNIYNVHLLVGLFGKPIKSDYVANVVKNVDTSGILTLKYLNLIASAVAGKDVHSLIDSNSILEGENGYIKIESPSNELSIITMTDSENKSKMLTTDKHRMFYEFDSFEQHIAKDDFEFMNRMLDHTEEVLKIIDSARKNIK